MTLCDGETILTVRTGLSFGKTGDAFVGCGATTTLTDGLVLAVFALG